MQLPQTSSQPPEETSEGSCSIEHRPPEGVSRLQRNRERCCLTEQPGNGKLQYVQLQPLNDATVEEEQTRQLLLSFADGNSGAFWRLWDMYQGHLYHLCLWQMDGVREDAEEALSRAMLRTLNKLPSKGPQIQNLRAWLSKLTLNLCVDLHRERSRQLRRFKSIEEVHLGDLVMAAADSPEETFLNREVLAYVCRAVDALPPRLREPFVLRFFQEMAYRDIAERLILSTENVRKRIQQARVILRDRVSQGCQFGWRPNLKMAPLLREANGTSWMTENGVRTRLD